MWLLYAAGSAFFAGVTSVLAKCGIRKTNSTVATAVRTMVILVFSWVIVLAAGSADFCLSHPLGSSNRSLLALLLPCSPGGAGQHRGAHRQAECACHGSIFLFCLWGKVKPPGAGGTAPSDGRNRGHGIHVKSKTIKRRSLFHRDQVADVRALSGEHIVIELLLPVNVVHTALQLLDGGEEGFSFLHKQELEKWKRYGQQTDF